MKTLTVSYSVSDRSQAADACRLWIRHDSNTLIACDRITTLADLNLICGHFDLNLATGDKTKIESFVTVCEEQLIDFIEALAEEKALFRERRSVAWIVNFIRGRELTEPELKKGVGVRACWRALEVDDAEAVERLRKQARSLTKIAQKMFSGRAFNDAWVQEFERSLNRRAV